MTKQQLLEIQGTDPRWLTREQLSWLPGAQLSGLTGDQLSWLTGAQLSGLTGDQLSGLTREQLEGIEFLKNNVPILEKPYTQILQAVQGGKHLDMKAWHTCKTTHCIGGWTVILAAGGKELEAKLDTRAAASLILRASRPDAPLPNFTASDEAAMAFIKARAKEELDLRQEQRD